MAVLFLLPGGAHAQSNNDFNVTVNTGPVAPNGTTVFPGEPTSIRLTLSNNSLTQPLTNVAFAGTLPTTATAGLVVNGPSAINGDAGCVGGALTTTPGQPGVTLSGLTVPVRLDGVPGTGECYVDVPIRAFSINGVSTTLSFLVNPGFVTSDQGANATGGPQAFTLRATQRPQIAKAFGPGNNLLILSGQTRTLTITVTNPDPNVELTGVAFEDIFPTSGAEGALFEPFGVVGGSCGGTTNIFAGSAARLEVSGVTVPASGSCTVQVEVRGRHTDGNYQINADNVIDADGFSSDQGLRPAADATATARVRSPLSVGKDFSPRVMASGTDGQVIVVLNNAGSTPLEVNSFTDDPIGTPSPGNLSIAPTAVITNSCAGGTQSVVGGGTGFNVSGFNIPANGSCTITVPFTGVSTTPDAPTAYTNLIAEGAVDVIEPPGQPEIVSEEQSASLIVADRLRILKARSPANAAPGEAVRYVVTVQNFADTALTNVTVDDSFQNGSTLLLGAGFEPSLTAACGALDASGLVADAASATFTIPTVPARSGAGAPGSCEIAFWVMISPTATSNTPNVIGAGDVCFNGGASCNQSPSNGVSTQLRAPVEFLKTFNGTQTLSALEGVPVRMRLELRNFAADALTDVVFSDTLPSAGPLQQLRIASEPNVSNSCGGNVTATAGSTSATLNNGSVPAFDGSNPGVCFLEVDVVGPAGSYPNTAEATGNRPNANGTSSPIAPIGSALDSTATVNYAPALSASKSFTPAEAADGATSTLEIRFSNLDGSQPITGVTASDVLPAGMLLADPPLAYSTCGGSPAIDAMPGGNTLTLSGAILPPGANCAVLANVQVTGTADWVNTIPAGAISADNGIVTTSDISATLRYVPPGVPLISKSINPGTIAPGQSATLTITITNGTQDLTGLSVVDWFTAGGLPTAADNGMTIAPAPQGITSCPGGIVTAMPGGNNVRLSGGSLAAGDDCTVSVQVTSTTVGTLTNRIPLNAIESDQGATNSSTFGESTLSTTSEIGIGKQFTPPVVSANEPSRLRIEFFNGSASALTDFAITDIYPTGLVNAPDPNPISSCGPAQITLPTPDSVRLEGASVAAAAGATAGRCFLEIDVVSAAEGTFDNVIPADTLTVRGIPVTHPPARATLQVRERIIVNKAFDGFTLDMGDPNGLTTGTALRLPGVAAPLTIRLENPNDIALTEVNFTDQLPDGLTLAVPPNASTTCVDGVVTGVPNGRQVTLAGARLEARGTPTAACTVTVDVFSNLAGVYSNEIPIDAVQSFEGVGNDPATQAQIVVSEPPTIGKDFDPPVIAPGAVATLRITLGNENEVDGSLTAALVDNLPASPGAMLLATPVGVITDCPGGAGIVTSGAGASELRIASGTVIPAGGCVVSVSVTATEPGDYVNTIPVGALRTTLGTSEQSTQATLRLSTLGYIAGKVFLDNQTVPDGQFLPGQSDPVDGNLIELRSGADCSGALVAAVQTDAQGNYLFSDLPAGTYSVCQPDQPADTFNSVTTEGTIVPFGASTGTPGSAGNPSTTRSEITGIVLGNNGGNADEVSGSPDNNFSEILPATLSGNVFFDADDDGVFDAGESGIGGVTIQLTGPVNLTTTTAADGSWSFAGLPPGDYTVTEIQPGGWDDGQDSTGTVDGAPEGAAANEVLSAITLGPGDAGVEYNFGEIAPLAGLTVVANAVCVNDAIYVDYGIAGFAAGSAPPLTARWLAPGGRVVEQLASQPGSGRLLWPGTTVDGSGAGTGWPGWAFVGDEWIEVADDRTPELTLELSFNPNPSGTATVIYPASTGSCAAQPPGTFRVQAVPASPLWMLLLTVLVVLGAGSRRLLLR